MIFLGEKFQHICWRSEQEASLCEFSEISFLRDDHQGAILGLNLVLVDGGQLLQNVCFGLGFACFLIMNYWMQNQFSSVAQLCPTPCDPMDCSTPGLPVHHQLPELAQTHIHRGGDAIQPSHPLSSLSPPAFNLSQHWVFSSESVLCIRWPKYWSFRFSISLSNESAFHMRSPKYWSFRFSISLFNDELWHCGILKKKKKTKTAFKYICKIHQFTAFNFLVFINGSLSKALQQEILLYFWDLNILSSNKISTTGCNDSIVVNVSSSSDVKRRPKQSLSPLTWEISIRFL